MATTAEYRRGSYFGRRAAVGTTWAHGGAAAERNLWHLEANESSDDFDRGYLAAYQRAMRAMWSRLPRRAPKQSIRLRDERRNPRGRRTRVVRYRSRRARRG